MRENKRDQRLGQENLNHQGCLMKVVEYINCNNIIIEFQDKHKSRVHTEYYSFLEGNVRNPYYPSVCGIGIIGYKYPTCINNKHTKEYVAWKSMLSRCYNKDYKKMKPTYENVICCNEWLLYENFYEWLHEQENFERWLNNEKWSVDKDILIKGNKIYSPKTCCLVPLRVNSLFAKCDASRGDLPIGVQKHQKKYRGRLNIFGEFINFPVRDSINEAFMDYKITKETCIQQTAQEEYEKGNITQQCYEAMMNYQVEITD